MNRLLAPVFLLSLLVAGLAGCASSSEIITRGLRIELTGIERAADGTVAVSWRVQNPNIAPYLFARVSHKIFVNETLIGTTLDKEPMAAPAQAVASRTTKLTGNDAANRVLTDAMARGTASYRVETQILLNIYDSTVEKSALTNSGTVPVTAK